MNNYVSPTVTTIVEEAGVTAEALYASTQNAEHIVYTGGKAAKEVGKINYGFSEFGKGFGLASFSIGLITMTTALSGCFSQIRTVFNSLVFSRIDADVATVSPFAHLSLAVQEMIAKESQLLKDIFQEGSNVPFNENLGIYALAILALVSCVFLLSYVLLSVLGAVLGAIYNGLFFLGVLGNVKASTDEGIVLYKEIDRKNQTETYKHANTKKINMGIGMLEDISVLSLCVSITAILLVLIGGIFAYLHVCHLYFASKHADNEAWIMWLKLMSFKIYAWAHETTQLTGLLGVCKQVGADTLTATIFLLKTFITSSFVISYAITGWLLYIFAGAFLKGSERYKEINTSIYEDDGQEESAEKPSQGWIMWALSCILGSKSSMVASTILVPLQLVMSSIIYIMAVLILRLVLIYMGEFHSYVGYVAALTFQYMDKLSKAKPGSIFDIQIVSQAYDEIVKYAPNLV
ncbi:hypothetical protein NECID01_0599 [Nematocida sp. AWRm77]|nr:hypothetical protein NECID01_0599 [Nematocida sp. AWRm77]